MKADRGLWTKNFTRCIAATTMGAAGGIAGGFALSFLVYEETQSTLAAALTVAIKIIPGFLIPLFVSPIMDRLPRKPALVLCDAAAAALYLLLGLWLQRKEFDYLTFLVFSLLIATIGSMDELSYTALFPKLIPEGMEEKGYSVSSMLYPVLTAIMMPTAAILYKSIGVANILLGQGVLCLAAALTENTIRLKEERREGTDFSLKQWWGDIRDTANYMKNEKGLLAMTFYSATSNGVYSGYDAIFVAFFSSTPGFSLTMFSAFTVVECIGRTVGGTMMYKKSMPPEKKYGFALFVYFFYDVMDSILLWLPYPLMLVNRTVSGFLGIQSGTMRYAATQKYIPESMRARITAFQNIVFLLFSAVLAIAVGALGEVLDLRLVMTVCGVLCMLVCALTIVRQKSAVEQIYLSEGRNNS